MQAGFVIANVGAPLRWIPAGESHTSWKLEVRPHLVDEPDRPFDICHFPEGYCYVASSTPMTGFDREVAGLCFRSGAPRNHD